MARNNPKPTDKLDWIPDDTTNILEPLPSRKASGWLFGEKPPNNVFNFITNLINRLLDYAMGQAEDWIVIDSDLDEGDYATLTAYLADSPTSGDRILIKDVQTVIVQTIIPSHITIKFLDGRGLLCATNIATSILQFGSNVIIEGVLDLTLTHTGTTARAIEFNGDNVIGNINVNNGSTGILTTAYHINANKTGNRINGFAQNTGGGTLTNVIVDNSTEDSNLLEIVDEPNNQIRRSRGAYKFREGLEFDLGSDADGDMHYRDAGILKRLGKSTNNKVLQLVSGLPAWDLVKQANIDVSAVGQGELKTTTGEVSVGGVGANLVLPGGEYGFYPQIKKSTAAAGGAQIRNNDTNLTTAYITYITLFNNSIGTTYAQQRYFQASPPYKLGNKRWGHFLFILRNIATGEIVSSYQAEDPPWAYNGPPQNEKDSKERIAAVPHPFMDYFDKNPLLDGLEIQLIDLIDYDVKKWKKDKAKEGKSILDDLNSINPKGAIMKPSDMQIAEIAGFTDKVKIRSRN